MKYYTPTIEEFHVGFEFESNYVLFKKGNKGDEWHNCKITEDQIWFWEAYLNDAIEAEFRVKHLDREDIESLGFIKLHETSFLFKKFFHLEINETYLHISDTSYNGTRVVFDGIIKNKSELRKLMIQLNIE